MPYVEFPADRVVNVHWKKKKDEPPPDPGEATCGAWTRAQFDELYPDSIINTLFFFVLDHTSVWGGARDARPAAPEYPGNYLPLTRKYLWSAPGGGWTVTYNMADFWATGPLIHLVIGIWRDRSLHDLITWPPGIGHPPTEVSPEFTNYTGMTVEIPQRPPEPGHVAYPPIFGIFDQRHQYAYASMPHLVQAHCQNQTTGGPPLQPPGFTGPTHPYPVP